MSLSDTLFQHNKLIGGLMMSIGVLLFFGLFQILIVGIWIGIQPHPQIQPDELVVMITEYFIVNGIRHVGALFLIVIGVIIFENKVFN